MKRQEDSRYVYSLAADGQATKIIIPSEIQGLAASVSSIVEVARDVNDTE